MRRSDFRISSRSRRVSTCANYSLKRVPQRKLHEARIGLIDAYRAQARDLARIRTSDAGVARIGQSRGVEEVEDVRAEVQVLLTESFKALEDGHVDALVARPRNLIAATARVLESSCRVGDVGAGRDVVRAARVCGPGVGECAGVVPLLCSFHRGSAGLVGN